MVALDNQNPEQSLFLPQYRKTTIERKQPLKSHLDLENKTCRPGRFCSEPGRCAHDKGELMNPERTKHTNNKKKITCSRGGIMDAFHCLFSH